MPPLRLALDATPLLGARTGIGVFTHELITGLAHRNDLAVTAYATTWRGRESLADTLPAGISRSRRPMAARPLRAAWRRSDHPTIERWTGPVDVVHGTNYVVPPVRRGVSLVSVHDLTFLHHPELCTDDTLAYPGLLRRALARGAHVHVDSAFIGAEVREAFGLSTDRLHVVALGVSDLGPGPLQVAQDLVGSGPYVLALGTVEPRKDLPGLVAAFDALADRHPDLTLVLAGPDGWGAGELDEAMAAAAHRDRIRRLARHVSATERSALVRHAAILAYPSRYEGFGLPPLEAMSVGTAVVATRAGSLPEVLGDAAEWCGPEDPGGLADALHRVLADEVHRTELVAAGHQQAARYSWEVCVADLCSLYHQLADRG